MITLEEYYESFDPLICPSCDDRAELQSELIKGLSEKDRHDFYNYGYHFRKTRPAIWKKIYKSLPLYNLFVHSNDKHLKFLYNKYRCGDNSVFKKLEEFN